MECWRKQKLVHFFLLGGLTSLCTFTMFISLENIRMPLIWETKPLKPCFKSTLLSHVNCKLILEFIPSHENYPSLLLHGLFKSTVALLKPGSSLLFFAMFKEAEDRIQRSTALALSRENQWNAFENAMENQGENIFQKYCWLDWHLSGHLLALVYKDLDQTPTQKEKE